MSSATPATKQVKKAVKKTEEAAAPVAAAPVAATPAPAAAPKASKKAAAPATTAAPVAATPVAATPAAVTAPAVEAAEGATASVQDDVRSMLTQANTVRETVGSLVAELKRLEKRVARLQKDADKRKRRGKKVLAEGEVAPPRKLSIFELPTPLSNELCSFLGRPTGSKESRSNVTKAITTYVKEKNLKDKHTIKPDTKLKALLGVADADVLTYFNLQRYLNRHYVKAVPAVPVAPKA